MFYIYSFDRPMAARTYVYVEADEIPDLNVVAVQFGDVDGMTKRIPRGAAVQTAEVLPKVGGKLPIKGTIQNWNESEDHEDYEDYSHETEMSVL